MRCARGRRSRSRAGWHDEDGTALARLAAIDRRFAPLRLISSVDLRRLRVSIEREGICHPVLVSTAVEADCSVLLDGFKRVRIAEELDLASLWAHSVALDAAQSKAAMLHANQAQRGLSDIEEAWIVRALVREHGMMQVAVGELLGRDKSWVCRRLKLAEALEATLQEDLRLGLLSASTARELARLPRGNQLRAATAVRDHGLTSRQAAQLVERLLAADDPIARREVLADPLRFIVVDAPDVVAAADPRLSERSNQLRRLLLSFEGVSSHLSRSLSRHAPVGLAAEEARVLEPLVHRVRVPAHDGHDSESMADTVPAAWRTVFRWHGGHFGGRIGTLSAMIS